MGQSLRNRAVSRDHNDRRAGSAGESRQVQGYGSTVEVRAPKYGSERTVYAAPGLVDILAGHVAAHCPGDNPDRWLFGDGRPVPPGTVGKMWRVARRKAGCDGMNLHHLRHYFASGLIAAGCDVVTVQRALGHQTASVTLNTYSHLWPSAEDRTGTPPRRCSPRRSMLRTRCGLRTLTWLTIKDFQ